VAFHFAHIVMNFHFVVVGYLFYWPIIGVDQSPRDIPHIARLGMMLASLPFHAFFGVILMNTATPIAQNFYQSLHYSWVNLLTDQRLGGGIAWSFGEIPLIIVVVTLLAQWAKSDEKTAKRMDRRADSDGDADLTAYNAMLEEMSKKRKVT
jgi:putative copper resistance protein D